MTETGAADALRCCDERRWAQRGRLMQLVAPLSEFEAFVDDVGRMLERALVARYGLEIGREAAADAIAYAVEHWSDVAEMANPVGYLYRVGQSSARRHLRWQRPDVVVREPLSSDQVLDVDLQRALMQLRVEQRVAVFLVHCFGHSYREVAEILDTTTGNVTNHVSRGLARLRELME